MDVTVATDLRFVGTPDGRVWTTSVCSLAHWEPWLEVFDRVRVAARVLSVAEPPAGSLPASDERVRFAPLPYWVGGRQYLLVARRLRAAIAELADDTEACVVRLPGVIGDQLGRRLARGRRPLAVELLGDPFEVLGPGGPGSFLRPVLRRVAARRCARLCRSASVVHYCTDRVLQARYPPSADASVHAFPGAFLEGNHFDAIAPPPRVPALRLVTVGSLEQPYKGVGTLLAAIARCRDAGVNFELTVIGDGRTRSDLARQASALGLTNAVRFAGQVGGPAAVRDIVGRHDIFVLASYTEGTPRALIEAMSFGMPCIATRVGGIPEVLAAEDLVAPRDAAGLAAKLLEVSSQRDRLEAMRRRNLDAAPRFDATRSRQLQAEFVLAVADRARSATTRTTGASEGRRHPPT